MSKAAETPSQLDEIVRASVRAELDEFRRFVDRRISELSMEIHATVQLVDYSETNLSAQLARIHEQIASVVAMPVTAAQNSGLELEAVVQATEVAANQIMAAAEAIGAWLQAGGDPAALQSVTEQVNAIFEACTFQDLTGQRIRRAIEQLQSVEAMLSGIMHLPPQLADAPAAVQQELGQNEVDHLFD
jgi:chemotaxis protein CheZ